MKRRVKKKLPLGVITVVVILVVSFFLIKLMAENRTEDFMIENYLIPESVYGDLSEAQENFVLEEIHWSWSSYCMVGTAYFGTGSNRISTTITLLSPTVPYALNMDSAKEEMRVAGSC